MRICEFFSNAFVELFTGVNSSNKSRDFLEKCMTHSLL